MKSRYQKIEELSESLKGWMDANKSQVKAFKDRFEMSYIYHENALEGVVVTGAELVGALETMDEATDAASVPIYQEIRTLKRAIEYLQKRLDSDDPSITVDMLCHLHRILCPAIGEEAGPCYRKETQLGHRSYMHEIVPPETIEASLDDFIQELRSPGFREMHTIDQACRAHWRLMKIFPFTERSGKIARLVANYILVGRNYEPMIIHATDRQRYYEAMKGSEESLRLLLVDALANSLSNSIRYFSSSRPVTDARSHIRN